GERGLRSLPVAQEAEAEVVLGQRDDEIQVVTSDLRFQSETHAVGSGRRHRHHPNARGVAQPAEVGADAEAAFGDESVTAATDHRNGEPADDDDEKDHDDVRHAASIAPRRSLSCAPGPVYSTRWRTPLGPTAGWAGRTGSPGGRRSPGPPGCGGARRLR